MASNLFTGNQQQHYQMHQQQYDIPMQLQELMPMQSPFKDTSNKQNHKRISSQKVSTFVQVNKPYE
jgi:hypothetical protein